MNRFSAASSESLSAKLVQLKVDPEMIPKDANVNLLQSLVLSRLREIMTALSPGTFVSIGGDIHLIKAYAMRGATPESATTYSYTSSKQCSPGMEVLARADIVDAPVALVPEAEYWRTRDQLFQNIQERIREIAKANERLMFDMRHAGMVARNFLDKIWPTGKRDIPKPSIQDDVLEDYVRDWIASAKD